MKQRLVGTLVLGSLALILIPLLLDGEGVERPPLSTTTPPAPAFETTPIPAPERPAILADTLDPDSAAPAQTPFATSDDTDVDADTDANADAAAELPAANAERSAAGTTAEPATAELATNTIVAPPADAVTEAEAAGEIATETATDTAQSISEPALDAAGLPEAWTIRLGSFGNRANADALVKRLVDAGHKAYIRPVGTLSGVFVGPVLTRNEAVALQGELKTRFQIGDAIVQRFDIAQ
jgi:cell division septation protein DedD